jgi:hypothetical protein
MIAHVGVESNQTAAIELARHAYGIDPFYGFHFHLLTEAGLSFGAQIEHGADAIAAVPAYGLKPTGWDDIIEFFRPVVAAAPGVPFLYYHIPGTTGIKFPVYDFLVKANASFPALKGIKYVDEYVLHVYFTIPIDVCLIAIL